MCGSGRPETDGRPTRAAHPIPHRTERRGGASRGRTPPRGRGRAVHGVRSRAQGMPRTERGRHGSTVSARRRHAGACRRADVSGRADGHREFHAQVPDHGRRAPGSAGPGRRDGYRPRGQDLGRAPRDRYLERARRNRHFRSGTSGSHYAPRHRQVPVRSREKKSLERVARSWARLPPRSAPGELRCRPATHVRRELDQTPTEPGRATSPIDITDRHRCRDTTPAADARACAPRQGQDTRQRATRRDAGSPAARAWDG